MEVAVSDRVHPEIVESISAGIYEVPECLAAREVVSSTDIVLELGGGLGVVGSYVWRHCQPAGYRLHEPNERIFELLLETLRINGAGGIETRCSLLADTPNALDAPTVDLHVPDQFWLASTKTPLPGAARMVARVESSIGCFDELRPTVLICDIEGDELDFFQGLKASLRGIPDTLHSIVIEVHREVLGQSGVETLFALFREAGFALASEIEAVFVFRKPSVEAETTKRSGETRLAGGAWASVPLVTASIPFKLDHRDAEPTIWMYWQDQGGKPRPAFVDECLETVVRNSECVVRVCSASSALRFVPDLPRGFDDLIPMHQSDVFRIHVLAAHGGMYIDCDTVVLRSLRPLFSLLREVDVVGADWCPVRLKPEQWQPLGSSVMGPMRAGSAFMEAVRTRQRAALAEKLDELGEGRPYPFGTHDLLATVVTEAFRETQPSARLRRGASSWFGLVGGPRWQGGDIGNALQSASEVGTLPDCELFTFTNTLFPEEFRRSSRETLLASDTILAWLLAKARARTESLTTDAMLEAFEPVNVAQPG